MLSKWRIAWVLALVLMAGPAFALGLGQIQVRSQYGEPFLAEIPIVSGDPAELRHLQARLASPETFARIGLEPPQGVVSDLQFTVALDAGGRPVVRVTSAGPVEQPLLTFLVEVDWGQGRLVREYSALVDTPDTMAAPAQPPVRAPEAAPAGTIVRPPQPDATAIADVPPEAAPPAEAGAAPETVAEETVAPTPTPRPPAPAPAATAMSVPGEYGPVQAGDTLSQIVQRIAPNDDVSLNQMMLALLRANPEAFIGGNVNLVRQGAVLRIPPRDELTRVSAAEATAEVRAQVARWREMSTPAPQPEAAVAAAPDGAGDTAAAEGGGPARTAEARLEIAPPSSGGGQQAGTRSGITAGGEGEMLRQEIQETRETLAARDAEVEELKARIAELEQLQQQQQQLITLKDSELAAAQQRLAESNRQPATTLAPAGEQPVAAGVPAVETGGGTWLWLGLGIALLLAALLAWLWSRREKPVPARSFRAGAPTTAAAPGSGARVAATPRKAGKRVAAATPTWHGDAKLAQSPPTAPPAAPAPEPRFDYGPVPTAETGGATDESGTQAGRAGQVEQAGPDATAASATEELEPGQERIELARAYVELGDVDTARGLLQEVVAGGSSGERDEAERLLREIG
ncbi:FimV/HubP family polar landmark protein [Luteimonas sp. R10]|uniref:FimV/HubP family polar landmark protein n=1 Tax=Luteimonas sp. R10 TaxID=3108176 RepID=UPI003089E577|nr:FimV/HubP family polar landmark protein [Luteimonas sp. R10]